MSTKTKATGPRKKGGAPCVTITPKVVQTICDRLANGESLRKICSDPNMPATYSFWTHCQKHPESLAAYEHALNKRAEGFAEEIVAIADEPPRTYDDFNKKATVVDMAAVTHQKNRIDARKWVAARLLPTKYGDVLRSQVSGPDGGPVKTDNVLTVKLELTK